MYIIFVFVLKNKTQKTFFNKIHLKNLKWNFNTNTHAYMKKTREQWAAKAAHCGQKTCRIVAGPYFKRFLFLNSTPNSYILRFRSKISQRLMYILRFCNQTLAAAKILWNGPQDFFPCMAHCLRNLRNGHNSTLADWGGGVVYGDGYLILSSLLVIIV